MKTLKYWKSGPSAAGAILLGALATLPLHAQSFTTMMTNLAPLDWWRLGETVASPPVNSVSNLGSVGVSGTGYVVGNVTLGEPGIVGGAAFLANSGENVGDCTARIDIPNNPLLNPQPPFSVEFWMMPNTGYDPSDGTGLAPISSLSVDGTDAFEGARSGYVFYVTPTTIAFRLGGPESYAAVATASFSGSTVSWTHVVGEFDGSTAYLYINGVLAASAAGSGAPFLPNPFQPTRIGGTTLPGDPYTDGNGGVVVGSGNRGWDGYIDKVAIYSNLLSASTVMAHYTAGTSGSSTYDATILSSNPLGYWNLNEPAYTTPASAGTFAGDLGSLMVDGTNTLGSLADQPGVPGLSTGDHSVFYSGAAGSLVMDSTNANWDVDGETITLMAWIKPNSFGYEQDIIAQGYDESSYAENFLRTGDSYDWEYFSDDYSYGNNNTNVVPGVAYYEIGTFNGVEGAIGYYNSAVFPAPAGDIGHWVFLVGTYDGVQWNLYRNGQAVGVFPDGGVGPSLVADVNGNLHPFSVGSRSTPDEYFGMFFAGSIQEAALLSTALTPAQVLALYNSVGLPPVITQAPVAPSPAYLGSTATFSVWADGPGMLTYQWKSNGVSVVGQTATNFTLVGLLPADSATYSVVVANPYGTATSSVVLVVADSLPPAVVVPAAEERWIGSPLSFALANTPVIQLSYQWRHNGTNLPGATGSNYTATTSSASAGSYTVVLSNSFASVTSSVATLTPLPIPTNTSYPGVILGDHPLSYWRLDEASGTTAYDYAGGNNGTYVGNVTLGVPGYSLVDTDTAVYFPGQALTYCGDINGENINFYGTTAEFTIEAWANGAANQASWAPVISKGHEDNGTTANEQFIMLDDGGQYAFIVKDAKGNAVGVGTGFSPDGNWHLLDGVCDYIGGNIYMYIDGQQYGTAPITGLISSGIINQTASVTIGAESSGPTPDYQYVYQGAIDEVAIYPTALSAGQISNHYANVFGNDLPPMILSQPVSVTNYASYPATLSVTAIGSTPLTYQWNMVGVGPISGATGRTFTIPNLTLANAGTYTVGITNTLVGNVVTGILSVPVTITVLPIPTNPPPIAGLVMHLPFDNNLLDVTGRGNNATNAASGGQAVVTNDYELGAPIGDGTAFIYQTTVNGTAVSANYATVGVRPDLQFGTSSFTVSFWIQTPLYYLGEDLPIFGDVVGSTFTAPGYCFVPSFEQGSWACSVLDTNSAGFGAYGSANTGLINDGNFHNVIYVMDRVNGPVVYLDGAVAAYTVEDGDPTIVGIGSIDSPSPTLAANGAVIGQDPTGVYPASTQGSWLGNYFAIQDLGVWRKALTPLQAAAIYLAGKDNGVSFTGAPLTFTYQKLPGDQLVLTWNEGELQSTTKLNGAWTTLSVTSPYTNSLAGATNMYYRVKF